MKIRIELKSPLLLGSGTGWGAFVDNDIVFDEYGLPYFPARRLKGMLKESALEVIEMFSLSGIDWLEKGNGVQKGPMQLLKILFGEDGYSKGIVGFQNLYLAGYAKTKEWMQWAINQCGEVVSKETVLDTLTEIRQHTSVSKDGTAKDKNLRTIRVLKRGHVFEGKVSLSEQDDKLVELLAFACANLRHVGSKRTRGFGEIVCSLCDENGQDISALTIHKLKEGILIV